MKYILVDFENVHESNYKELLSQDVYLEVFLGESQNKIPTDLVLGIQDAVGLGRLIQISGNGKNALDFHIAYELGRIFSENKDAECIVVSKDTGYNPLIAKICKDFAKKCCRRVNSISELLPVQKQPAEKKPAATKPAAAKSVAAKPQPAPKKTAQSKNNTMTWDMVLKLLKGQKTLSTKKSSLAASIQSWAKQKKLKLTSADKIIEELQKNKHLEVLATGKIKYLL